MPQVIYRSLGPYTAGCDVPDVGLVHLCVPLCPSLESRLEDKF
jgi:hypothetical protein